MSLGFDPGTFSLICAKRNKKEIEFNKGINAFIEIPLENPFLFNMMKNSGVPLIEKDNIGFVLGESAVNMAYTLASLELKRPMSEGCVNPKEKSAFEILQIMIHSLIGEIDKDEEKIYYCVPANAVNVETDADYHQKILHSIFKSYRSETGYKLNPHPINEALAVIYAELQKKAYTGIGISCLCPGTKIYTNKGLVNIEDVEVGDEVLTHKGRWRTVYDTVATFHQGEMKEIIVSGISGKELVYKFVDNHKLYVKRNDEWSWVGCDDLKEGDIVGEPVEKFDKNTNRIAFSIPFRNTCSKIWTIKDYNISEEMCELIGYFLGDGSVSKAEGAVNFDFAIHEKENVDNVINLAKIVFDKDAKSTIKSENCTRVKIYSKPLVKWFYENCYRNKNKKCPFDINQLTDEECKALLAGLINSDGTVNENQISFYNSNTHLISLCKRLFSRVGIAATIDSRSPRTHISKVRGVITARKTEYRINTGQQNSFNVLEECLGYKRKNKTINRQKFKIVDGFLETKIKSIKSKEYNGLVYDLRVAEDHSFSGPNLTISNCGGGMVNVCYAMYGNPVFQFAIVNSGDWIDKQAAKATGESTTVINKEKLNVDLSKEPKNMIERAIGTQYRIMIEKTVQGIKNGLANAKTNVRSAGAIDVVVAGGTSCIAGFDVIFKDAMKNAGLSIELGDITRADNATYTIAKGCLIAAENSN